MFKKFFPCTYNFPKKINFDCVSEKNGKYEELPISDSMQIYGLGLTYRGHIRETKWRYDYSKEPDNVPPVFIKENNSIQIGNGKVKFPGQEEIIKKLEYLEENFSKELIKNLGNLKIMPLLDYEAEIAIVLKEEVDWERVDDKDYSIRVGFCVANDLSARSIALMGLQKNNTYDYKYWGLSKNFDNFLPISDKIWIPDDCKSNSFYCTQLKCIVNGIVRQSQETSKFLYTIPEMLNFIKQANKIRNYPKKLPKKNDLLLTGTPKGVAVGTSCLKLYFADILKFNRFKRLKMLIKQEQKRKFLQPYDTVVIDGGKLGKITTQIISEET
jgi:2-keto-4-pentenoate hydratase/2-oxohepta-3-ene-1,7-dioic acid hydratase in catechol pathway